uniref:hypothetical protein n=1 Tax=Fluviicola sp. TaxID=1917219 RepID=UPI004049D1AD
MLQIRSRLLCAFLFIASLSISQTDSSQFNVYDIIHLKTGVIMKGEILSLDSNSGVIVFKDLFGRKYTFGREEYQFFEENVVVPVKKKRASKIYERKDNAYTFHAGISLEMINLNSNSFQPDGYFLNQRSYLGLTSNLSVSFGKYLGQQHYFGGSAAMNINTNDYKIVQFGARYTYHYKAENKNTVFYLPVGLQYQHISTAIPFDVNDTVQVNGGWIYPKEISIPASLSSVQLSFGQGITWYLDNLKAISLEINLAKSLFLSHKIDPVLNHGTPNISFSTFTFGLGLWYHF